MIVIGENELEEIRSPSRFVRDYFADADVPSDIWIPAEEKFRILYSCYRKII
jgi:hypothetical protein